MHKFFIFLLLVISADAYSQHVDFIDVNFNKSDSIADVYQDASLKDPEKLTDDLTRNLTTDDEKFRAIFKWITNNVSYNYDLKTRNEQKEQEYKRSHDKLMKWKMTYSKAIFTSLYTKKSTVCSGYATLLQRMCRRAGIECKEVIGYGRTNAYRIGEGSVNHAWNAVSLSNKWYLCDATWASGHVDDAGRFHRDYNRHYFLADPHVFAANHYPVDTSWLLIKDKPSLSDFKNAPIIFEGYHSYKINRYLPGMGTLKVQKKDSIMFRFTSNVTPMLTGVTLQYWSPAKKKTESFQYTIEKDTEGFCYFSHPFSEKGKFDVYIYGSRKAIFRYEVIVR